MSCRQPPEKTAVTTMDTKDTKVLEGKSLCVLRVLSGERSCLVRNDGHLSRFERFEKPARLLEVELSVSCFDAQKKSIAADQRKPGDVEDRVIRLRQAVESEHSENRGQRGAENGAFEGDCNESRPPLHRVCAPAALGW